MCSLAQATGASVAVCTPLPRRARGITSSLVSAVLAALLVLTWSSSAAALHPLIEAARTHVEDAAFEEALAALDAAWQAELLSRDDVVTILAQRALVHFALRAHELVELDLSMLAALDRTHVFASHVPIALREHFAQKTRTAPSPAFQASASFEIASVSVQTVLPHLPGDLLRGVQVGVRNAGGAWVVSREGTLSLPVAPVGVVEWYAEVIGPGGARLLSAGDRQTPRQLLATPILTLREDTKEAARARKEQQAKGWRRWAAGGAAALVLAAVAAVVVRHPPPDTRAFEPSSR